MRSAAVDVTDRTALRKVIDEAASHYGSLDVAFANVGIDSPPGFISMKGERTTEGAFENVSDERWDKVMATNLTSIFTTIKAVVPHMKKAGGGRIIVTTSIAGIRSETIVGTPLYAGQGGRGASGAPGRGGIGEIQDTGQRHCPRSFRHQYRGRPYASIRRPSPRSRNSCRCTGWPRPTKFRVPRCSWHRRHRAMSPAQNF